jgi:hypothetical protein
VPFKEADLAGVMLNSVPVTWVNQYKMTHSMLSTSPRVLLPDLEATKRVMNKKHRASLKAKAKEEASASNSTKRSPRKSSTSGNPGERVPKRAKPAKFCQHCKNKGGPHPTHNTNKCRKYNTDRNPMAAAAGKPSEARKPFKKGGDKQMAYLTSTIESLVKKEFKKAAKYE